MDLQKDTPSHPERERGASPEQVLPKRRKRRVIIFGLIVVFNLGLLLLLGLQVMTPAQNSHAGTSPLIGHGAPDFTLPGLSLQPSPSAHLAQLKGHAVILNFWASWCDACKEEASLLETTWLRVQPQGVILLGINFEDTQSAGQRFLQRYGITYPNVVDTDGSIAINYGVAGVPETYFINKDGVVAQKVIGPLSDEVIRKNLRDLL